MLFCYTFFYKRNWAKNFTEECGVMKNIWKYILIGSGAVVLEWIFLSVFYHWLDGMGELGGIVIGVGFFLAFEMVICTGAIISKINTNKDK